METHRLLAAVTWFACRSGHPFCRRWKFDRLGGAHLAVHPRGSCGRPAPEIVRAAFGHSFAVQLMRTGRDCVLVRAGFRTGDADRARAVSWRGLLRAHPHQCRGYANGYKTERIDTPTGTVNVQLPKTAGHEGEPFYPQSFERGRRSVRAIMRAVTEIYVKGVSTRDTEAVMREFGVESLSILASQPGRQAAR